MKKSDSANIKNQMLAWVVKIFIITIVLATIMSLVAEASLRNLALPLAFIALFIFIFIGVFFDTIGIAVATADSTPFVAMSSKKIKGAKEGLFLLQRAEEVSSICNDVVGDICGIISGAAGAIIVTTIILMNKDISTLAISVIATAVIAAITVSGKALGKMIAMRQNKEIVLRVGKTIHMFARLWRKNK